MKTSTILWGLVVVLVIVGVATLSGNKTSDDTVKIGAILPVTGWGAYWGEKEIRGIELAKDDIAAVGGKVEVIVEDGATDAAKSVNVAQKLINVDKVHAFFTEFTAPAGATAPLSKQYGVPMIYDAVTKSPLKASPYAFKAYFDIDKQCYVAAKTLADEGKKRIGTVLINLDFNAECKDAVERAIVGKNITVFAYDFPIETVDFRTIIAKMKADKIDAVVPVFYEDNSIAFFKQLGDLKFKPAVFMGIGVPDGFTEKVRSSVAKEVLEGVRTYDQKINEDFKTKIKAKYPEISDSELLSAAYGYDETMYLYRGVSACANKRDAVCVTAKILADKDYKGALDTVSFGGNRILNLVPHFFEYKNGALVEFVPDVE